MRLTTFLHPGAARHVGAFAMAFAALSTLSISVLAQTGDVQRCREVKDPTARLACYDAIPLSAAVPARPAAPLTTGGTVAPNAAASATTAATSTARAPQVAAEFGLERKAEHLLVKSIESRILGKFDGWEPNTRFTLENGQVWQVSDDSRGFTNAMNPTVKLTRGTFGTFFLEIQGINAAPRVKRIK